MSKLSREQIQEGYRQTLLQRGELVKRKHYEPEQFSEQDALELQELDMLLEFQGKTYGQTEEEREAQHIVNKTYELMKKYSEMYPGRIPLQPVRYYIQFRLQDTHTFSQPVVDRLILVVEINRKPSCISDMIALYDLAKKINSEYTPNRTENPLVWVEHMHQIGRRKDDQNIVYLNLDTQNFSQTGMP